MVAPATYDRKSTPQAEEGDALFIGLNSRLAPDKLPPGYLAAAQNYRTRQGQLDPRLGLVKPGWLNVTGDKEAIEPVAQPYGKGVFRDPSSVEWVFTAADGQIFRHREHNVRFAVTLPAGVSVLSAVSFTQAFNKLYCFRGRHLATLVLPDIDTGFVDVVALWSASAVYKAAILNTGQVADEIAYGPFAAITSLTSVGDLATCVTTAEHGFITGADVTIKGAVETGYNGRWNITVLDEVTFQFNFPGASASPATGTPVCSNMRNYWRALGSVIALGTGELTSSTTTATVTHTAHGFTTGQYVTIAGATQPEYNGTYIITVTDANTFTYVFAGGTSPATGTITAQTSVVLAGQSPDTNAAAWHQIFNILPNADDALFINNRLLIPTALTPGVSGYDATSTYTKKDFIVATDILDDVHFDFENDFRINQGSDDEIVALVKYAAETAIVIKGKSWGVLSNIGIDLSNLALDMHTDGYGGCAPRSAVVAGKDVLFPVTKRGIVSIVQNQLGQLRSVDVPFSNDIPAEINRINWNYASLIRLAYWDDKLYCAVPLDNASLAGAEIIPAGTAYGFRNVVQITGFEVGKSYLYEPGNSLALQIRDVVPFITVPAGAFVAQRTSYALTGPGQVPVTASIKTLIPATNNALLVYDYRAGQGGAWQGIDTGLGICPREFFKATYNGAERLFFTGADGFTNLVEEDTSGDQVMDTAQASGLRYDPIATSIASRGYRFDTEAQKQFKNAQVVLGVWDAQYSVSTQTGAANSARDFITDKTFSRFNYLRPFDKAAYVDGNGNDDFATPGRGNYAVYFAPGGLSLGALGLNLAQFQEVTERVALSTSAQRYTQVLVSNSAGRCVVKSITPVAAEGQRRGGTMI
jgi:hypothetical protein